MYVLLQFHVGEQVCLLCVYFAILVQLPQRTQPSNWAPSVQFITLLLSWLVAAPPCEQNWYSPSYPHVPRRHALNLTYSHVKIWMCLSDVHLAAKMLHYFRLFSIPWCWMGVIVCVDPTAQPHHTLFYFNSLFWQLFIKYSVSRSNPPLLFERVMRCVSIFLV